MALLAMTEKGYRVSTIYTGDEVTYAAVTAKNSKAHLTGYLGRVQFGGAQLIITKNGKPAAAIVPVEKLLALQALEDGTVSLHELRASLD